MEVVIEVFKTNVSDEASAMRIIGELRTHFPDYRINFDLQDCDRILRIEGESIPQEFISEVLKENGFWCEVLE